MEHDTIDTLNEIELRIYLRRALSILNEIKYGSNDDCEYSYNWVQLRCQEVLTTAPDCKICKLSTPHAHQLSTDGYDVYYHPVIPWTRTS